MKKLSIRPILVLVLALILVFSLVACGDKGDGGNGDNGNNNQPTVDYTKNVTTYFNALWDKTKGIGSEKLAVTDDLKVSLGLEVAITTEEGNTAHDTIDLGIALDVVLDRSTKANAEEGAKLTETKTALKAKFYDPNTGDNWFTAYYFFNDVDNLYVDFSGQHVQIPFDYINGQYNDLLYNYLDGQEVLGNKTISDIIVALTKNAGSDWTLNTLIDDVTKLFNLDLQAMLGNYSDMISTVIGLKADELFVDGRLDIQKVLSSKFVSELLFVGAETTNDVNGVYTTKVNMKTVGETLGLVSKMVNLPSVLTNILTEDLDLVLQFTTDNEGAINSFTIKAILGQVEATMRDGKKVSPAVAITIKDLKFAKAKANEIENSMAVKKDQYTANTALNAEVALDLKGIALDVTAFDKEGYTRFSKVNEALNGALENLVLDGKLVLGLSGKLDLKNKEDNKSKVNASLKYVANGNTASIIDASFVGGTLAVSVNQDAKIGDVKIVDALVRLFGDHAYNFIATHFFEEGDQELAKFAELFFKGSIDTILEEDAQDRVVEINPEFKGAAWSGIDIVNGFQRLLDKLFKIDTSDGEITAVASKDIPKKTELSFSTIAKTITSVLPLLSTAGDKLTISTTDGIGTVVAAAGGAWDSDMKDVNNFASSIVAFDHSDILAYVTKALKVTGFSAENMSTKKQAETLVKAERKHFSSRVIETIEVTEDEVQATRNAWKLNQYTSKDTPEQKAAKDEEFNNTNRAKVEKAIRELKYSRMKDTAIDAKLQELAAASVGSDNEFTLRFVGKTQDEVIAAAGNRVSFLVGMFDSNATVSLDISEENGVEASVLVTINNSASVAVSAKLGAKAFVAADYTNYAPMTDAEAEGWYVYNFAA